MADSAPNVSQKIRRQLSFKPLKEDWNEYLLEDGQVLKMKVIVTEVYELEGVDPVTNKKNYLVKSINAIAVESSKGG